MKNIPFHIQEIAKIYPLSESFKNNLADGKIENWTDKISSKTDLPKPGSYITLNTHLYLDFKTYIYHELWVHLGNSFFKQVLKIKIQ